MKMVAIDVRLLRDVLIRLCETASPGTVAHVDEEFLHHLRYLASLTKEDREALKDIIEVPPEDLEDFLRGTGKVFLYTCPGDRKPEGEE